MTERKSNSATVTEECIAEVMRLHYADGLSMRAVSRKLGLSRNTVRRVLGRVPVARATSRAKRDSMLDPYLSEVRKLLDETPEMQATTVSSGFGHWGTRAASRSCAKGFAGCAQGEIRKRF